LETVTWPRPQAGLVIRYSFLWSNEANEGREEGIKDRPCTIVIVVQRKDSTDPLVRVLPITHSQPVDPSGALELPPMTKQRFGLDSERSWIILDEANDFIWPGPDLRPAMNENPASVVYGMLPSGFVKVLKERILARHHSKKFKAVRRTE
jgi:hypothetical protein